MMTMMIHKNMAVKTDQYASYILEMQSCSSAPACLLPENIFNKFLLIWVCFSLHYGVISKFKFIIIVFFKFEKQPVLDFFYICCVFLGHMVYRCHLHLI